MLRKIWIVCSALALANFAYVTVFAVEEAQQSVVADAPSGGVAEATTWTVCSSGCDFTSIQAAVDAAIDGDTIEVGAGTFHENVSVSKDLIIRGSGPDKTVVDGDLRDDVFEISAMVTLSNMTIQGGLYGVNSESGPGLDIENCIVQDNTYRGVVSADSNVVITTSMISGNGRGGIGVVRSEAMISSSSITGNSAYDGGGIAIYASTQTIITDSMIDGNAATFFGGGIYTSYSERSMVRISSTTISNNTAQYGGGLYAGYRSETSITNSTISGNTASSFGGGIYASAYNTSVNSSTVAHNEASRGGGGIAAFVGGGRPPVELSGTIVANNAGDNCRSLFRNEIASFGFNLSSDDTCNLTEPTDVMNMDPLLESLTDNGGPTQTHALAPGSPAVDAGGQECPEADQRGMVRPQDGNRDGIAECDIGAYEYETQVFAAQIDIKPDSHPNSINPYARGVIPVAILGSDIFDVASIDVTRLAFGPGGATTAHDLTDSFTFNDHLQDVNLDGFMDLVTHFRTRDSAIACGDESATLTGATVDGQPFEGTDSIQTVGCRETRRPAIWMKDQDRPDMPRREGPVNIERK